MKEIELLDGCSYPEEVGILFQEYIQALLEENPAFSGYLAQQNYERELAHLEEKYGRPGGRLYLLKYQGQAAGTVALRKLDETHCELKRLYIRPAFRGHGFAEYLVRTVMEDGIREGYQQMLLDTFPFLTGAIKLYRKLGFYEVPSYNGSPMEELLYMAHDLP